ncbi:MAG: SufD family Fe-S cluster assembly protein [Candidatus Hadarchaeales archaeon]
MSGEEVLIGEGWKFKRTAKAWGPCQLSELPRDIAERAQEVGVRPDMNDRSGAYFQIDHSVVFSRIQKAFEGKAEIMSVRDAMKKYKWLEKFVWSIIDKEADEYTRLAANEWDNGYFIRIFENQKITLPLQACLFISTNNLDQNVHNVILAEPGSEAHIITGCTVHPNVRSGLHVGISEFFVKENAKLTFTMIHAWGEELIVRPRTGVLLEDGATFVSNYVSLKPVRSLQMFPTAYCRGDGSRAVFNSIIYGSGESKIDAGTKILLEGKKSRGEIISRSVAADRADMTARGLLIGKDKESRGHLECMGLILSEGAVIRAFPELIAEVEGTELSHEAAVGKIAEEQIFYLMSRGFSEDEARSLIVKGFMNPNILTDLPEPLKMEIEKMIELTMKKKL